MLSFKLIYSVEKWGHYQRIMIWLFILLIISGGVSHHYQYSTVAQAAPGEASPYSVSSELYKHVLPGEHSAENIFADLVK